MSRIKEVVDIVDFYDRSGSDPFILRRAVGRNQNRVIIIFIAYKISGRRQKNTVTIGVAAFFQVINIIYAVFIVRHAVSYKRLHRTVFFGKEIELVYS